MPYRNTAELLNLLKKHNLWVQKKLGQNFLVNQQILNKIIKAADLQKEDYAVEIGPGLGVLTAELAHRAKKVTAIEIDRRMIPILQEHLANFSNVEIQLNDALKTPLPTQRYKLVANIPYYITSPLLNHFLQPAHEAKLSSTTAQTKTKGLRPSLIVLLVQKEVAEKICAREGDHSILSLQVQIFGKPEIVCTVNKSSFFPQPKVDSAILKIKTYREPLIANTDLFFRVAKAAFATRRKTLQNSLQNGLKLNKNKVEKALAEANISTRTRPQELKITQWRKLLEAL